MNLARLTFLFSLCALFNACSKQVKFVDVAKMNSAINKGVGIDILSLKRKTDLKNKTNPDYYTDAMIELGESGYSEIFRDFGLFQIKNNGDSLEVSKKQKNLTIILNALKISIDTSSCSSNYSDTICSTKKAFVKFASRNMNTPNYYIDYWSIAKDLHYYRKDKIINEEEYKFLVLYFHVILSIDCQGNKPPPSVK